ncbi:ribosome biogenesis protein SLX9-domain-containing protein [Xylogone sp. PMI_703]|nr:ribosome biogenesis protein SLX9-domain-containing protein [Xylogone sp. PMI_703]
MAPTAPKKRPSIRGKALKASKPVSTTAHLPDSVADGFSSSKKDKRLIKHSAFKARIEKKSAPKPLKRRRPNKKLVTTLNSLVDALPDIEEREDDDGNAGENGRVKKIKQKSLKSRPGVLKKRVALERRERERFGKNLAVLATSVGGMEIDSGNANVEKEGGTEKAAASATAGRWAALRGFISQTLEQKEEFRR